jgi:hypothetical protein
MAGKLPPASQSVTTSRRNSFAARSERAGSDDVCFGSVDLANGLWLQAASENAVQDADHGTPSDGAIDHGQCLDGANERGCIGLVPTVSPRNGKPEYPSLCHCA